MLGQTCVTSTKCSFFFEAGALKFTASTKTVLQRWCPTRPSQLLRAHCTQQPLLVRKHLVCNGSWNHIPIALMHSLAFIQHKHQLRSLSATCLLKSPEQLDIYHSRQRSFGVLCTIVLYQTCTIHSQVQHSKVYKRRIHPLNFSGFS